jgi:hypothetical protein
MSTSSSLTTISSSSGSRRAFLCDLSREFNQSLRVHFYGFDETRSIGWSWLVHSLLTDADETAGHTDPLRNRRELRSQLVDQLRHRVRHQTSSTVGTWSN